MNSDKPVVVVDSLPPVHPRCRVFNTRMVAACSIREFAIAGETPLLQKLRMALLTIIFQPGRRWLNN